MREEVYRGAVKIRVRSAERILYTKTYNKSGTARGQATILRKSHPPAYVIDVWVEKAVVWENIDEPSPV